MQNHTRFLVVVFDALRPDMISPELTPNLSRFKSLGTTFVNNRSVFPSDTRANVASFVTGAYPQRHGFMGNAYFDPLVQTNGLFNSIDATAIERADKRLGGRLFEAVSLGEVLAQTARTMAVISCASSGTTRLIHHKVRQFPDHLCIYCHGENDCSSLGLASRVVDQFGPMPPASKPDLPAIRYATDVFLRLVWPEWTPDVTVIWFNEPDTSYHGFGVRSENARNAISFADAQFGRLLEWWIQEGRDRNVQLLAMSDHGQIDTSTRVNVNESLEKAGLKIGASFACDTHIVNVLEYPIRIYVRDRERSLTARVIAALACEPWCGLLFSRDRDGVNGIIDGTFSHRLVFADHRRAPDVCITFRSESSSSPNDLPEHCFIDSSMPLFGIHGGLSIQELSSLVILGGSLFREDVRIHAPSGIVDLMPTILAALQVPHPSTIEGTVLHWAFRDATTVEPEGIVETFTCNGDARQQTLKRVRSTFGTYLEGSSL